jgi:hypothetical protein
MPMRPPRDELGNRKRGKIIRKLLDNKVIRHTDVGCCEPKVRECEVKTIHRKRDFTLQLAEIGLLERRSIADDKSTFPFVNIFQLGKTPDTLTSPRMEIRIGQFRNTSKCIIGITRKMPNGLWNDLFEGLFHAERNSLPEQFKKLSIYSFICDDIKNCKS